MMRKLKACIRHALLFVLGALACAQPTLAQPVPSQGPGGPILVVHSPTSPFANFYAEILRNEGFNEFAVATLSSVSATTLQSYDVVLLAQTTLTSAQVTMFSNWVNAGGNLVAM